MSGNRPSLAGAFAPVTARGAKLEGMLAPKRKREETPSNTGTTRPLGSSHIAVVPEPLAGPELANAPTKIIGSETDNDGGGVADTPRKSTAAKASPSAAPSKPQQNAKKAANTHAKASQTILGAPRNVGVYLAPELLVDVKESVHLQRITYADLLLDAFEALDEDVIANEFKLQTVPSTSGMPRRAVRRRGTAGIQIQVRLDDEQIAWLDAKVVQFNAPSRSALVSTAYRLFLAKR
jgi:hypothetical protein